ncbi:MULTISPECIES: hypothetical protein [Calothrix]|uniref:Uncharacterized protein n=2 Tax=Calothrix TaxID=1186 RepID=A0ABR8AMV7_9CYAN|nr:MULTISPECIES: hypothetical protein [Calothrix]MBD2199972.1 hypothetical protein [Calothrix parietina FACHB-288]MBD2228861.1 hypothetical protein [Calothrix anomala FACHB-343]
MVTEEFGVDALGGRCCESMGKVEGNLLEYRFISTTCILLACLIAIAQPLLELIVYYLNQISRKNIST